MDNILKFGEFSSPGVTMGMVHLWFVMLWVSPCGSASDSLLVVVGPANSVPRGGTATLPCWITPPQSAEALEVRWYRDHFDIPILHYRDSKFTDASQDASYVGRVSFGTKDATSGGLKTGDVSLKLRNVALKDTGNYTCYVSSHQGYDSKTTELFVTETGSSPLLSAALKEENVVNISCESEGWYPQPVMRWADQKRNLTAANVAYRQDSSGLYSAHGWVLVSSNSLVFCSVGLSHEVKEGRFIMIHPEIHKNSDNGSGGWVAFGLVFGANAIALAVFGAWFMKKRGSKSKSRNDEIEGQPLIPTSMPPNLYDPSQLNNIYVNVKLEETNNPYVTVKDNLLRDKIGVTFPDGQRVTCLTAVKGTPGFSSGRHYWEVSLKNPNRNPNIEPKQSWWVGVTSMAEIPQDADFSPNTSNGFWFLSSSSDIENKLEISTEPRFSRSIHERPCTVGVYLDRDRGVLSFYNVEDKCLIGSLTANFRGEVFPVFNPGKGDASPMEILHRTEQSQEGGDTGIM
ncbi:unnamed protein product [Ophioblennius macclurei]